MNKELKGKLVRFYKGVLLKLEKDIVFTTSLFLTFTGISAIYFILKTYQLIN